MMIGLYASHLRTSVTDSVSSRSPYSAVPGMMTAAFIWGTWVIILAQVSLPGIMITPITYLSGGLALLALIATSGNLSPFLRGLRDRPLMVMIAQAAFLETIQYTLFIVAFDMAIHEGSAVVIPIIRALSGVVTPLLAVLSRIEAFAWRFLLSGLLASVGSVLIFTRGGIELGQNLSQLTLLLVTVSVIVRGWYYLKQGQVAQVMLKHRQIPTHVLAYHSCIAALILLPVFIGYRMLNPEPAAAELIPQLLFIGIFGLTHTALGGLLRLRAMRYLSAQQTIIIMYIEPVTSVSLAILFLGEQVTLGFFLGAGLVLFSTAVASLRRS